MLKLNFSNMLGEVIGESGISEREIEGIKTTVYDMQRALYQQAHQRRSTAHISAQGLSTSADQAETTER